MIRFLLWVSAVVALASCAPDYEDSLHLVSQVNSGNEILLSDDVRVRLIGVADTPANAAALSERLTGQRVRLAFDSNQYPADIEPGMTIPCYVLLAEGESLNRLLIQGRPEALAASAPYDSLSAFTLAATGQPAGSTAAQVNQSEAAETISAHAVPVDTPENLSDLVDELEPAVFLIETNGGKLGTGFFVGPNGLAVSNHHVFKEASAWQATLADGRKLPVTEIVEDRPDQDYVIFRVGGSLASHVYLRPSPATPRRASSVYVIGNPNGLERTFTTGVVSALRTVENPGDVIQFDAAISHGSSGSPVLNPLGEVVGIATFKHTDCENCNFAVNIRLLNLARFK